MSLATLFPCLERVTSVIVDVQAASRCCASGTYTNDGAMPSMRLVDRTSLATPTTSRVTGFPSTGCERVCRWGSARARNVRRGLADDGHRLRAGTIRGGEVPAGGNGDAQRREVTGLDDVPAGLEGVVGRDAGRADSQTDALEAARDHAGERRVLNAGSARARSPSSRQKSGAVVSV